MTTIHAEIVVMFGQLSPPHPWTWDEIAWQAYLRKREAERRRSERWYARRRARAAWREERNERARMNARRRLAVDKSSQREQQKSHRARWWAALKADPERWANYKRKRDERNRKRYR